MAFSLGLSFGTKKQSGTQDTTLNKTTQQQQAQSENKKESTTGGSQTSSQVSNQSAGTSSTDSLTQGQQSQSSQTAQTGKSQTFSDSILAMLESSVANALSGQHGNAGTKSAEQALGQMGGFDIDSFVNNSVNAAASQQKQQFDSAIGQLSSAAGGTDGTNSMMALLAQQMAQSNAANLEGVRANAIQTGQGILAQQVAAGNTVSAQGNDVLSQLLTALKGGTTQTTATGQETGTTQVAQSQSNNTATTESSQQQANQQTQMFQDVISLISSLLSGTQMEQGTENVKTTGKSSGFGISAGI